MKLASLRLSLLSLLTLLIVGFSACKDKDEPTAEDTNEIVGSWKLQTITPATAGVTIPLLASLPTYAPCYQDLVYVFKSDNTVSASGCDAATAALNTSGILTVGEDTSWKVENNQLKLVNGATTKSFALTQNDDVMSITVVLNEADTTQNILLTFERQ
ncbi:lipocalin-like protein [Dyadobacter jejuensis]|uniref:Lipocalin-like protein n=1 Tax=Dyadobacter jejuensis TaxID=1082580 RepID=A0A316AQI3_9BACT|nr:lipocalin family protein [Dyadobacter jejuensis]PWJ59852.1 lipocalin-like protein [Dyadobacter jejuensis]